MIGLDRCWRDGRHRLSGRTLPARNCGREPQIQSISQSRRFHNNACSRPNALALLPLGHSLCFVIPEGNPLLPSLLQPYPHSAAKQGRGNVNLYHSTGEKCALTQAFNGRFFLFLRPLRLAHLPHTALSPLPSQGMVQLHFNAAFTRKSPFTSCYYRTRSCRCFAPRSGCFAPCSFASTFSPRPVSVRRLFCSLAGDFSVTFGPSLPARTGGRGSLFAGFAVNLKEVLRFPRARHSWVSKKVKRKFTECHLRLRQLPR